jgi:heavy metal sensor kinase
MRHLNSLRVRFALWTAGLIFCALVVFGFFVYVSMSRGLASAVDDTLHLTTLALLEEIEFSDGKLVVSDNPLQEDEEYAQLREQGMSMRVLYLNGELAEEFGPYQDLPLPQVDLSVMDPPGRFTTLTHPRSNDMMRVYTYQIVEENSVVGILQVALSLESLRTTLNFLLVTLLVGTLSTAVLAGGGGYFLAARALAPVDKIIQTAHYISSHDLSARLNLPQTDDELGRLSVTFDSMMDRLENAFQRERQFTADASHELRTPISGLQTIIDSTLARRRTPAEYERALRDLGREGEQMSILVERLLHLARNDSTIQPVKFEALDLSTLVKDVAESFRPVAEEKGLQLIDTLPDEGLAIHGDSDGLIRLFFNLIDNAIKYTNHGVITVSAHLQDNHWLDVRISDTGAGIAAEHLSRIFERFYRADESRSSDGYGLGLAIAHDIAIEHGGTIFVESEIGEGTTFVVRFPSI